MFCSNANATYLEDHVPIRKPDEVLNVSTESQFSNMQRRNKQRMRVSEQVGHAANCITRRITFHNVCLC